MNWKVIFGVGVAVLGIDIFALAIIVTIAVISMVSFQFINNNDNNHEEEEVGDDSYG